MGSSTSNYYFSYNATIPNQSLLVAESLSEANKIIDAYSYGIKFPFVKNENGEILLRKPKGERGGYKWTYAKGGADDSDSSIEDAAMREVKEETGLDIKINQFIGLYSSDNNPVIIAAFSAKSIGGKLYSGYETDAVDLIEIDSLSEFPFEFDEKIYNDYLNIIRLNNWGVIWHKIYIWLN